MKSHLSGFKSFFCLGLLMWLAALLPTAAQTPSQNLFVASLGNGYGQSSIIEFTTLGTQYTFATNLDDPYGMVFDQAGNLYVADYADNAIYEFTNGYQPGEMPVIFADNLNGPVGLALDRQGNLYEADDGSGAIYEFTNGYHLGDTPVTFANNLNNPVSLTGLAFDPSGNLFAANDGTGTIYEFTNGYQLGETPVIFADNLYAPTGVAFDQAGNLYATDDGGEIYKFATNGTRTTFATGLDFPAGLAFDGSGNLYEGDSASGNVYGFTADGTKSMLASGLSPTFLAFDPVTAAATTTAAHSSIEPAVYGQSVTFTAAVTVLAPGVGIPTGTITYFDGTTNLGSTTLTNGQTSLTISTLAVGNHNILVEYSGDANFQASATSISQIVNAANTTNVLTVTPSPTVFGQSATLTATVTVVAPGAGTVAGNVTFFDGTTSLGTSALSGGVATLNVSSLTAGDHSLTAVYAGNGSFTNSTSSAVPHIVNLAGTITAVHPSSGPVAFGQTVTFTAQVNAVAPGAGVPTGTVTFFDGPTNLGSATLTNGLTSLAVSTLSVGAHNITLNYSGDLNFQASSAATNQIVYEASTTTTLIAAPNPTVFGQSATLTATVTVVAPGAGTVAGTVTFFDGATSLGTSALSGGVATLNVSSLTAGNHSLTAVYADNGSFTSSTSPVVTQVVNQAISQTIELSSPGLSVFGQTVTFTANVTAVAPGAGVPTGTVSCFEGATNLGSGSVINGQASLMVSSLPVGLHHLAFDYSGDANFQASSFSTNQIVNEASTTTALAATPNPTVFGQSATLTATVTVVAPGAGTVAGTVTFFDGATSLGTSALSGGVATLNVSSLAAGNHSLTAVYADNGSFTSSTSPVVTQVVNQAISQTIELSSPGLSVFGQTVTFTANVTAVAPGAGVPTGTVSCFEGTTNLASGSVINGQAALMVSSLPVGLHYLVFDYSGDANFRASSFSTNQIVNEASTTTALAAAPNPTVFGQPATLTATVTAVAPGAGIVAGTVTFYDGTTSLGTGTLANGVATLTVSSLLAGNHSLTAAYASNGSFNNSTSPVVTQVVNQASSQTIELSSPGLSVFGQPVSFTANVSAVAPGAGVPTGTVTCFEGTTNLASGSVINGQAALMVSSLPVGLHYLVFDYSGDANFQASSFSTNQIVNEASTTTALAAAPNPTVFGQPATLTATVTAVAPGAGIVAGTVTFYDGTTSLGTGTLANGVATLTVSSLLAGNHSLTAAYADNGSFSGSTSPAMIQAVDQAATITSMQASSGPTVFGQPVTFTAIVDAQSPGAGVPTGTVTYFDGTTNLGSGTLINGRTSLTISTLAVGIHTLVLDYSGDANFQASNITTNQIVNRADTANTLIAAPDPTVFGQPAIFTATLAPVAPGAGTPSGTVTFFYNGTNSFGTNTLVNGTTSITNAALPTGTNLITAIYSGDADFNGSTSSTNQTVNRAATMNAIISDINPSVSGQAVTFTATVSAVAPGAGVPSGTVTFFYDGTNGFATNTLVNGATSITNATLPIGTNFVTAVYSGDTNFTASTTAVLTQPVISLTSPEALATGIVDATGPLYLQSGLMQQLITISNLTSGTYTSVRVTLHLTQAGIRVYDATGTNSSGDAYLQYNYPVPPHRTVTFAVEYYVADRTTIPNPVILVTLTTAQPPLPVPPGTAQSVVQSGWLAPDNAFMVGFETQVNTSYYVLYSSDLTNWNVVLPAVEGNGSEVQWLDLGPPLTQSPPGAQSHRFYRVIKAQ